MLEQKAGNHPARPTIVGTGDIVSDLITNLGDRGKGNPQCGNNTCADTTLDYELRTARPAFLRSMNVATSSHTSGCSTNTPNHVMRVTTTCTGTQT